MKRGFAIVSSVLLLAGCQNHPVSTPSATVNSAVAKGNPLFTDEATKAGVKFIHTSGASGKYYYIESTPPGCAFLDYDGDGWQDVFLIQSGPSGPFPEVKDRPHCVLYHNRGDGTFTETTVGSGLDTDISYGQGVTVGDYDNDGYPDILVTSYDRLYLFHNEHGTGKFTNVTKAMGLDSFRGYFTSAAFGDYDNDGRLDLYVCRYSPWNWKTNIPCTDTFGLQYCSPEVYDPETHLLLHNDGVKFRDVSKASGILSAKGRGLGVAFLDYNNDGKVDIFVANDLTPNMLWKNRGNGTFENVALSAGCAFDASGQVMAGMGVTVGDYDHSGNESIFAANFSDKPNMLFRNIGGGLFEDASYSAGVALPHMKFLTFGTEFMDYDADGSLDLFVVNGHVQVDADKKFSGITYKERKQLFHNNGKGLFTEITGEGESGDLSNPTIGRGLAIGDYDNDGRLDALVANQNGATELLHNETGKNGNHWVSFLTVGTKSNREGRHTRFTLTTGGVSQTNTVRAGSSYLSHSDRRVYFGLGSQKAIEHIEIHWPSGTKDTLTNVTADTGYIVTEGKGITGKLPHR